MFGQTGKVFLDVWTIVHFSFWIFVGSCLWAVKANRLWSMVVCLLLAFAWEVFEKFAEKLWPHLWLSPESLLNSFVSDLLTCVLGLLFIWYALDNWRS